MLSGAFSRDVITIFGFVCFSTTDAAPRDDDASRRNQVRKPRDAVREPRDGVREPRDGVREPRDAVRKPRDAVRKPRDAVREPRDAVGYSGRHGTNQREILCGTVTSFRLGGGVRFL